MQTERTETVVTETEYDADGRIIKTTTTIVVKEDKQ